MSSYGAPNRYQLSEDDEILVGCSIVHICLYSIFPIAILIKSNMEKLEYFGKMEYYQTSLADIMGQLRIMNPVLHSKLSSNARDMYLSSVKTYLIYNVGCFRVKPAGCQLLRDINFSKRIEHPNPPLPVDTKAVEDRDVVNKYIQELQDNERRLNPRPAPIIEAGMSSELEYLVRTFNGRRKVMIDANSPDISKQDSSANSLKDCSGYFGWKANILLALALGYPREIKVVMDRAKPAFISLNGEIMAYEGIEALKQIDAGVVYNSEEGSLQITDIHQFVKNPCVDKQFYWLTEFYNLFENLTVLLDVCGGKLNLREVDKYTFETKVVSDALTHALSICFRLPHIFSIDGATISYDKDVLQRCQREGRLY